MFHYRLALSSSRSRMLIAGFLAIALHMGLMNFEFNSKPVFVPNVSLPRSVSVFLGQKITEKLPVQPAQDTQPVSHIKKEQPQTEKEPEVPVPQKIPTEITKPDNSLHSPDGLQETVEQHAEIIGTENKSVVEDIVPVNQELETASEVLNSEVNETAKIQKTDKQTKYQAVQKKEGVILPGTLQMAYPRYQVNAPPTYPGLARKRGLEGTVILQVLVNREGRVDDLEIDTSSNFALLDRAAVSAVRKWSFEPGRRGKESVPMWVRVPITFKLRK